MRLTKLCVCDKVVCDKVVCVCGKDCVCVCDEVGCDKVVCAEVVCVCVTKLCV